MPLITSTTALNKLKWGNDRFNAGQTNGSNQPYITRDIPGVNVDDPNPTLFNDGGDLPAKTGVDFLLRNGFRAPADALTDVSRLFKMFTDTRSPNGILFTAAQNLLSRTAVKTEASKGVAYAGGALNEGIYTPLSTLAQAGVGFTGTHLNLMGLDPTGLTGAGLKSYFKVVKANNDPVNFSQTEITTNNQVRNPLFTIDNLLPQILGSGGGGGGSSLISSTLGELAFNDDGDFNNRLINLKLSKIASATDDINIMSYGGGPGSIIGIGKTHIRFADQRTGVNNPLAVSNPTYFYGTDGGNHYNLNPQSKDFISKLGASIFAQQLFRSEEDREEIVGYTTNEQIENENGFQSTIRNAELSNNGFFRVGGEDDNYSVFFRPSANINYLNKLGASKQAEEHLPSFQDKQELFYDNRDEDALQSENSPQSTIRNAQLSNKGFFEEDQFGNSENFSIFYRPGININYATKLGASVLAAREFDGGHYMNGGLDNFDNQDFLYNLEAENENYLLNENSPQSAIKNAELIDKGFFRTGFKGMDPNGDDYSVFFRPYADINYLTKLGATTKAETSLPSPEDRNELFTTTNETSLQNENSPQSTLDSAEPTYLSVPLYGTGADFQTYSKTIQENNRQSNFFEKLVDVENKIRNPFFSINNLIPQILGDTTSGNEPQLVLDPSITMDFDSLSEFDNRLLNLKLSTISRANDDINIMSYSGGEETTFIRFADQRTGINNKVSINDPSYFYGTDGRNHYNLNPQSKDFISKLGASLYAQELFRSEEDREEIIGHTTNEQILNENSFQSTIRNSTLSNNGFFGVDDNPNNYSIFARPSNTYNLKQKNNILSIGVSEEYVLAFPTTNNEIYESINRDSDGAIQGWFNNVYQDNLVTVGKQAGGAAYQNSTMTFTQAQLAKQPFGHHLNHVDFRKEIIKLEGLETSPGVGVSNVLSLAPNYINKAASRRVNRGDPGKTNQKDGSKNVFNYGLNAKEQLAVDKINAMPMYDSSGPNKKMAINDFAKFRIAAINNDKPSRAVYMHFRAFIDSFTDTYNSAWNPVQYSGRGDKLYNYTGFERTINMGFTCWAQSKAELVPMYKKLNYLASTLAPDYTAAGFMRGNIVRLTLGGYIYELPGFISSLVYEVPKEAPWELSIDAVGGVDSSVCEIPHMIRVTSLVFTAIHDFIPQKPNNANVPNERYISLSRKFNSRGLYKNKYPDQIADGDGDDNNTNNIPGE